MVPPIESLSSIRDWTASWATRVFLSFVPWPAAPGLPEPLLQGPAPASMRLAMSQRTNRKGRPHPHPAGLKDLFWKSFGLVVQRHEAVGACMPVPGAASNRTQRTKKSETLSRATRAPDLQACRHRDARRRRHGATASRVVSLPAVPAVPALCCG